MRLSIGHRLNHLARRGLRQDRRIYFGLNDLDRELDRILDVKSGFFVEAGANDGVRQSNTLHFEFFHRWSGLLVEPVPELADACRRNRPNSIVEEVALVAPETAGQYVSMTYCDLMTFVEGALGSPKADAMHARRGEEVQDVVSRPLSVRGQTLSSVLVQNGITHVDLLSLDVEGYEPDVLRGLDFSVHRPQWILVEVRDARAIEEILGSTYEEVDRLSHHDVLFRCLD